MADGLATTIAGMGGGSGTTTYAENIGVMAATKVYSHRGVLGGGYLRDCTVHVPRISVRPSRSFRRVFWAVPQPCCTA